jgi:perosamine synthetase
MPSLTYVATATPALNIGLNVRLCDVDPETWMPARSDFENSISAATRVLASVDLFGMPSGEWVTELARINSLWHVNDGAESLGSFASGEHAGKRADVNTLSIFANKTITTGEGGMILTDNEELEANMRLLKNQGLNEKSYEYDYSVAGYNFRMTNLTASIGVSQIQRIGSILAEKKRVYNTYVKYLDGSRFLRQKIGSEIASNYWLASFLCPSETIKNRIRATLSKNSIESRPFFKPLHLLPFVKPQGIQFPVSEDLWHRGISLPSYPDLNRAQHLFLNRPGQRP